MNKGGNHQLTISLFGGREYHTHRQRPGVRRHWQTNGTVLGMGCDDSVVVQFRRNLHEIGIAGLESRPLVVLPNENPVSSISCDKSRLLIRQDSGECIQWWLLSQNNIGRLTPVAVLHGASAAMLVRDGIIGVLNDSTLMFVSNTGEVCWKQALPYQLFPESLRSIPQSSKASIAARVLDGSAGAEVRVFKIDNKIRCFEEIWRTSRIVTATLVNPELETLVTVNSSEELPPMIEIKGETLLRVPEPNKVPGIISMIRDLRGRNRLDVISLHNGSILFSASVEGPFTRLLHWDSIQRIWLAGCDGILISVVLPT